MSLKFAKLCLFNNLRGVLKDKRLKDKRTGSFRVASCSGSKYGSSLWTNPGV
jgi:hypothetical protein